ncbi:hypothetical protein J31TS4_37640 [Paenibacillus sp. J31TS4]|uniref:hypothetical protein n=1 Tax=Paenibacillus sp. J31TS4 TaxID=2807195 RepID=UPI001B0D87EC|nr:hypothetical protein [Paenibacillus sp. J31TS4]GIP40484.1 hypothetical protein J31TS4_37640 [Paenibacillus sp. J31TS4]
MNDLHTIITRNLAQYCYPCRKSDECATEDSCIACWLENGLLLDDPKLEEEVRRLLKV